jgi:4-amino-4-deoxy-L-arabinose transferase-like glycosyltransferase
MIDMRDWRVEILKSKIENPKSKILLITLLAFFLRVWQLDVAPPGWRDDELIETLVMSHNILDGQWAFYYPDASGHEPLYHIWNAAMLALFGPTVPGIRWLSAILGTLAVPLLYVLGKRLFGERVGLVAAAALALSFWGLMYSRFGIRHVALPPFVLAAFFFFWRGLEAKSQIPSPKSQAPNPKSQIFNLQSPISNYLIAGLFLGFGFYTYFASRGVPLILIAFAVYLALFDRPLLRRHWLGMTLTLVVAVLLAVPLVVTLRQQPELEARVSEVGRPLMEARAGNFGPMVENTIRTLNMFHSDGDDEWLYNIPFRPVFGLVGAVFFWSGVVIALWYAMQPVLCIAYSVLGNTQYATRNTQHVTLASAFLLLWWLAGITPGFLSIPAGSLSHTIVAQPAVYLLAALPLLPLSQVRQGRWLVVGAAVLLAAVGLRDLPDYFGEWPNRGMTRFLYRAELSDVADYLAAHPSLADFAITGLLAGPWDREALKLELTEEGLEPATIRPRWYNPERVIFLELAGELFPQTFAGFPVGITPIHADELRPLPGEQVGGYALNRVEAAVETTAEPICFDNGLCWLAAEYDPTNGYLELTWRVERPLELPPLPLISNPPPPGVYAGPRLYIFGQLLDEQGNFLAGDDGLWVDPLTLYPGDVFIQQHRPVLTAGMQPATLSFGLYDPMTGERILTEDGRDHLSVPIGELGSH